MGWFGKIFAGAGTGAAIGSVVPGVGTVLGAGIGAIGAGFLGTEDSTVDNNKNYDDLPWYSKIYNTVSAKREGLLNQVGGAIGLDDVAGTSAEDRLAVLKHKRSDDFGTSFQMGTNISGASGGEGGQMGGVGAGGASPNQGVSLGRALALEDEPALQDQNYNDNNFNF